MGHLWKAEAVREGDVEAAEVVEAHPNLGVEGDWWGLHW